MAYFTPAFSLSLLLLAPAARSQSLTWTQIGAPGVYTFATSPDYANDGLTWFIPSTLNYEGTNEIHVATQHGDAVQSWGSLPGATHLTQAFTVSPTFAVDSTMFATSYQNTVPSSVLWKSTDAGLTWNETPQPAPAIWGNRFKIVVLSPDFANDQIILASQLGYGPGTQRSSDGGASWSPIGLLSWPLREIKFADDFATSGMTYGFKSAGSSRFFQSSNFGAYWTECSHPVSNPGLCPYVERAWGTAVGPVGPQGQRAI